MNKMMCVNFMRCLCKVRFRPFCAVRLIMCCATKPSFVIGSWTVRLNVGIWDPVNSFQISYSSRLCCFLHIRLHIVMGRVLRSLFCCCRWRSKANAAASRRWGKLVTKLMWKQEVKSLWSALGRICMHYKQLENMKFLSKDE